MNLILALLLLCRPASAASKDLLVRGMENDSAVLGAIGEYYIGLSRLQLVHPAKLAPAAPEKERGAELNRIADALAHFKTARTGLSKAISGYQEMLAAVQADEAGPFVKGLKFVARFSDSLDAINTSLDSGFLPDPSVFNEANFRLQDYVLYGKKRTGSVKRGTGLKFR